MRDGNETLTKGCRFLRSTDFPSLHETFTEAFSDYVIPFALTETQLKNHIILTAVDLDRSVGYFEGGRLVGFSLNGFGEWNGLSTVYDACTGVLPAYRRRGISREMFRFMLPLIREGGIEQFLLEVIKTNEGAVRLYEGLGFKPVRELGLFQCDRRPTEGGRTAIEIEVREIDRPDWELFREFWDVEPSWQNSSDAINRSLNLRRVLGAFYSGNCVGYIVFSGRYGRISQLAVSKDNRRLGIGSALIHAVHTGMDEGYSTQVVNADLANPGPPEFFDKLGYYERLRQYEMVLNL